MPKAKLKSHDRRLKANRPTNHPLVEFKPYTPDSSRVLISLSEIRAAIAAIISLERYLHNPVCTQDDCPVYPAISIATLGLLKAATGPVIVPADCDYEIVTVGKVGAPSTPKNVN